MPDAHDPFAATRSTIVVEPLVDADAPKVAAMLDAAERSGGDVPLVDEAEARRLGDLARTGVRADAWYPLVARVGEDVVGYAAVLVVGDRAVGDAAAVLGAAGHAVSDRAVNDPGVNDRGGVLLALLEQLVQRAADVHATELEVWVRRATDADLAAAERAGLRVARRLAILGADLPTGRPAPPTPEGIDIRAARPDEDDTAVVAVLAAAYGSGPDGGWDVTRFRERRQLDWFRAEDLLVAVDQAGRILGLHWLKRRSATVGEVYNLAVHPDAQGRGLGPVLLHAGLDHLAEVGCHEVLLWVDRANHAAVRLYTSQGLTTRWDDVALGRHLSGSTTSS